MSSLHEGGGAWISLTDKMRNSITWGKLAAEPLLLIKKIPLSFGHLISPPPGRLSLGTEPGSGPEFIGGDLILSREHFGIPEEELGSVACESDGWTPDLLLLQHN